MSEKVIFLQGKESMLQVIQGNEKEITDMAGNEFQVLDSTMSEGAGEKHLPVVKKEGNTITVQVGSILHPMLEEHSIQWIYLVTKKGGQLVMLHPGEEPVATFLLAPEDEAVTVYEFCNIHGLWETQIQ